MFNWFFTLFWWIFSIPNRKEPINVDFYKPTIVNYEFLSPIDMSFIETISVLNAINRASEIEDDIKCLDAIRAILFTKITQKYTHPEGYFIELSKWTHYKDDKDNKYYHYDESYISQYLALCDSFMFQFVDEQTTVTKFVDGNFNMFIEHIKNSSECIRKYISENVDF